MSRTWRLTDVELIDLWDSMFQDRLPTPLFALYRGADADEWARLRAEAGAGLADADDGELRGALTRVARADVVVSAKGFDPRHQDRADGVVRVLGGRQGSAATLISQLPGETAWHSGGYVVTTGAADRLAGAVAGALPERAAGRLPDTPLVPAPGDGDTDHYYGRSKVQESYSDLDRRSAEWLGKPAEYLGVIETRLGSSIFGPRGITRYRIEWRDLVDDGRYAVAETAVPVATAVDRPRLATMISAHIATVLQTLEDERRA
ncbi:ESAT-6 protein secretion system EspG family protein [Nocardia tenerifensis]|uniref:ESAT-6 protein secretion system EspG family protein n=1 Tax=Nocardia tenerifensis TaxID=228006 RepID=A0A318JWP1_9NOCA|nr:ESX secretion-associated protein EspG [Nocardia tenerifensis]PXX61700.1 ESAT-6 protein secretion system EspG family protein [Nocardia tenerifensis]